MNERIKELAEQAETYADEKKGETFRGEIFMRCFTEKFAELVEAAARKDEREACAMLCELWIFGREGIDLAAAIRARGEK
jgi:hypothetical protein